MTHCHFSGFLQLYPYESLASVLDKYRVFRLSSFDTLYANRESDFISESNIALIGGLNYEYYEEFEDEYNGNITRGPTMISFPSLYGTKIETETIASLFYEYSPGKVRLIQGTSGSEAAFYKLMSDKNLNILHLATHSYSSCDNNSINKSNRNSWHSISDYLLDFHVIVLSGANLADVYDDHEKNNLLTGYEISKLNLSNIKLVVLSCCGSNKDQLESSLETSWDLVSAFKIAGVRTILYALWDIPDESTVALMISFYRHLLKGESITDSLSKAKLEIRNNPKWSDFKSWAQFVLIDAI